MDPALREEMTTFSPSPVLPVVVGGVLLEGMGCGCGPVILRAQMEDFDLKRALTFSVRSVHGLAYADE